MCLTLCPNKAEKPGISSVCASLLDLGLISNTSAGIRGGCNKGVRFKKKEAERISINAKKT